MARLGYPVELSEAWLTVARHRAGAGLWRFDAIVDGERVDFGAAYRAERVYDAGSPRLAQLHWLASVENEDGGLDHRYFRTLRAAARWCLSEYLARCAGGGEV